MKLLNKILMVIIVATSLFACKKYNQIDNGATVKTPYTLFYGCYNGIFGKTNDALTFKSQFHDDNSQVRQIVVADSVVCFIKKNFYYSPNDGFTFYHGNDTVASQISGFYKYFFPNLSVYDQGTKRIYLTQSNWLAYSTDLGKTFVHDNVWVPSEITPTSITQTANGDLFSMKDTSVYKKVGTGSWNQVAVDTPFNLPVGTLWYISHTSDTLMAVDFSGVNGVYYSPTGGSKWYACKQLPNNQEILFGNQVFGSYYVGLDSAGLYRFSGNQFVSVGKGIPWYAKVSFVVGKTVRYRTDYTKNYYFCATDQGLYISETDGTDWRLIYPGTYSTLQ